MRSSRRVRERHVAKPEIPPTYENSLVFMTDRHYQEGHAPPLRKVFTAQVAAALLNMARQGQGVAWIPLTLAADDIKAGRLLDAGEGDFSLEVEIRLFRPLHRQSRSAESFWDMIVASK